MDEGNKNLPLAEELQLAEYHRKPQDLAPVDALPVAPCAAQASPRLLAVKLIEN